MAKDNSEARTKSKSNLVSKIKEMNQELNLLSNEIDSAYRSAQTRIKMDRFISILLLQYRDHLVESTHSNCFSLSKKFYFDAQNFMDFSEFNYAKLLLQHKDDNEYINKIGEELRKQIVGWLNAAFYHLNNCVEDYTFIYGDEKIISCEVKNDGLLYVKVCINIVVE